MKRWMVYGLVALLVIENVLAAGVVARKGGWRWLARQWHKAAHGAPNTGLMVGIFEACPNSTEDVYLVGDSLTAFACWSELIPGHRVCNRGVPGDTTAAILARLNEVTEGRPRVVAIMAGINDLLAGRTAPETIDGLREIVRRIRETCPETRIVLQSVLPVNPAIYDAVTRPYHPEAHRPTVEEVGQINTALQDLAGQGIIYLDLWPAMTRNGDLREEFTLDGVHVNGAGYLAWASALRPIIEP